MIGSVQSNPVQLRVVRILVAECRIIKQSGGFVDQLDLVARIFLHVRKGVQQTSIEMTQLKMSPVVCFCTPNKSLAVGQESQHRRVFLPGILPFCYHGTNFQSRDVDRENIENVLTPIGPVDQDFVAFGRKPNIEQILCRIPIELELLRLFRIQIINPKIDSRVIVTRFGVTDGLEPNLAFKWTMKLIFILFAIFTLPIHTKNLIIGQKMETLTIILPK